MSPGQIDPQRLRAAMLKAAGELLAERNESGFWEGELSSSALSTATAVTALAVAGRNGVGTAEDSKRIQSGLQWLAEHQNADGGWGDTTKSFSNISTTTLCWAAFGAAKADGEFTSPVQRAERWLREHAGSITPDDLATAIIARYGKDRTFSVPILTMCALAGRLGSGREAWHHVIPLPFELAAFPHQFFAALRLPVVSYALPALIAIGQARHVHAPSLNPFARVVRNVTRTKTLRVLESIQPSNGGFLEATPLTSFVTMSLAASGQADSIVTQRGLAFLRQSQRTDGSWPIDTNLSTWCTTLSINALDDLLGDATWDGGEFSQGLPLLVRAPDEMRYREAKLLGVYRWLIEQQYRVEHPYTHAAPGGWAWTDLPGGVPDADDTAGALIALGKFLGQFDSDTLQAHGAGSLPDDVTKAAQAGIRWLLDLQNRDGGIPTFCRGWGSLPFDRSSPDLTAHALRAWRTWTHVCAGGLHGRVFAGIRRAEAYLRDSQCPDGSWLPLWFGNQHVGDDENPIYGTTRVLLSLRGDAAQEPCARAIRWIQAQQNADGSWGGAAGAPGSVEETSLAVEALAEHLHAINSVARSQDVLSALKRGSEWLVERVENGAWREPAPIGFYFAKLWYFERLYPMIFTVGALRTAAPILGVERPE